MHGLALLSGLSGEQRAVLASVAVLFILPPVLVLYFTRRPDDPRLNQGCADVLPALVPALALWALSIYALRKMTWILKETPGWLVTGIQVGGPTFLMLPLLITGLLLATSPRRATVLLYALVSVLTLLFDAWLMHLPGVIENFSVPFNPGWFAKVLLFAVLWAAAAPVPLIILSIPLVLLYVLTVLVRALRGERD